MINRRAKDLSNITSKPWVLLALLVALTEEVRIPVKVSRIWLLNQPQVSQSGWVAVERCREMFVVELATGQGRLCVVYLYAQQDWRDKDTFYVNRKFRVQARRHMGDFVELPDERRPRDHTRVLPQFAQPLVG